MYQIIIALGIKLFAYLSKLKILFFPDRAVAAGGMERTLAVWVVSAIGITNTIGRIVCGAVTNLPGVNALFINNIALTMGGIATIFSGLSLSLGYQFTYAIIFGISIGKNNSLY
jgi:hypothetical protein